MNRDNLLFVLLGFMLGFVGAYLAFEAVSARQPPRRVPGAVDESAAATGVPPAGGGEGAAAPGVQAPSGAPPGAPMAEIAKLRDYVQKHPEDKDAVRKLANLNFDIGNWQRAQDLYLQFLKVSEGDPDLLTDLGITYRELGKPEAALERFREAEKLAPAHWQSRFNQVVVLGLDLARYDEADRILADLRRTQPGNPDIERLAAEVAKKHKEAA